MYAGGIWGFESTDSCALPFFVKEIDKSYERKRLQGELPLPSAHSKKCYIFYMQFPSDYLLWMQVEAKNM